MRVDLFGVREDGAIDGKLHRAAAARGAGARAGQGVPARGGDPHAEAGPSASRRGRSTRTKSGSTCTVTSGDRVHRPQRRHRSGQRQRGRSAGRTSSTSSCSTATATASTAATRRTSSRRSTTTRFRPGPRPRRALRAAACPRTSTEPVTVEVKLQYRKFDTEYMEFVAKNGKVGGKPIRGDNGGRAVRNELPITTLAVDRVTFPVAGVDGDGRESAPRDSRLAALERLRHRPVAQGQGRAAAGGGGVPAGREAGRIDGPLTWPASTSREGRLDEAVDALQPGRRVHRGPPAPPWTLAWLSGLVNQQQGRLDEAEHDFRRVLEDQHARDDPAASFDFSLDYEVLNQLGVGAVRPGPADSRRSGRRRARAAPARQRSPSSRRRWRSTRRTSPPTTTCSCSIAQLGEQGAGRRASRRCTSATSPTTTPPTGPCAGPREISGRRTMPRRRS